MTPDCGISGLVALGFQMYCIVIAASCSASEYRNRVKQTTNTLGVEVLC
jgi:hypothetical protein